MFVKSRKMSILTDKMRSARFNRSENVACNILIIDTLLSEKQLKNTVHCLF